MTIDHAISILTAQLLAAKTDGRKMDWKKQNYIDALTLAIEVMADRLDREVGENE